MKGHIGNPGLKGKLVDKSIEAYILALETINRLSVKYRIEAFCYLICNAWELLLKAKILEESGTQSVIYYPKQRGEHKRSLTLRDCLERIMPKEADPEKLNIKHIADLRDESVHLVFSRIPSDVLCLFQAGVINYHKRLSEWFGISLSDRVSAGMMSLVYDMQPGQNDLTDKRLRREMGRDAANYLTRFCAKVKEDFDRFDRSAQFSIGIEYHLVLTKKQDEADIQLSAGSSGGSVNQIIEVPKDPSKSHPFRQKEVIEQIKSAIAGIEINQYDIQSVIKTHSIKKRAEYYYHGQVKGSPVQYSPAFVDWIIKQIKKDDQFFQNSRLNAKIRRARKKEPKP